MPTVPPPVERKQSGRLSSLPNQSMQIWREEGEQYAGLSRMVKGCRPVCKLRGGADRLWQPPSPRGIASSAAQHGTSQLRLLPNASQLTASSSVAAGEAIQLKAITLKAPHSISAARLGGDTLALQGRGMGTGG